MAVRVMAHLVGKHGAKLAHGEDLQERKADREGASSADQPQQVGTLCHGGVDVWYDEDPVGRARVHPHRQFTYLCPQVRSVLLGELDAGGIGWLETGHPDYRHRRCGAESERAEYSEASPGVAERASQHDQTDHRRDRDDIEAGQHRHRE